MHPHHLCVGICVCVFWGDSGTTIELVVIPWFRKMVSPKKIKTKAKRITLQAWNFRHLKTVGILAAAKIMLVGSQLSLFSIKTPIILFLYH